MKIFRINILILFVIFFTPVAFSQTILTGKITNSKAEPLLGANIYVLNQNNRSLIGTITDTNGEYRISVPATTGLKIVFSFIGYKTKVIEYKNQSVINITLEEDIHIFEDVDVVAQKLEKNVVGLTQREQVTSTQRMSLEKLETAPMTSVAEALQGALSNVDVLTGADPGSKTSIRIRGTSSLNASSEPLIVVDGVSYPADVSSDFNFATATSDDYSQLLNISPNDIESIEVLKDAAATAMWGSKGANGVLLFKTKKGSKGRIKFTFASKFEYRKEANTIPMLDEKQYRTLMQDAILNTIGDIGSGSSANTYFNLLNAKEIGFDPIWIYFNEYNQNTKWISEITRPAYSVDNNFSMSGGGEKANYRFSLGYAKDEGITIGTQYQRLNTMLSIQYRFSDRLDISTDIQFTHGIRDANWDNPRDEALYKMPNMSPYTIDEYGNRTNVYFTPNNYFQGTFSVSGSDIKGVFNPVALVYDDINRITTNYSRVLFNLHYKITESLDYYGIVGIDLSSDRTNKFLPQTATGVTWTNSWFNRSLDGIGDKFVLNTENRLIYNKYFSETHKLTLAAILQTREQINAAYSSETAGNASASISDPITSINIQGMGSGKSITREYGFFINGQYAFKGKYLINGGYRFEANSSLGPKYRLGGFPTIGVAWQLGDEEFVKKLNFISLAKVRVTWGQSGNTPGGSYPYIGIFQPSTPGYINMNAVGPVSLDLENLKWETVTQTNGGIDIGLFEGQLGLSLDVYYKLTSDLLQKDVSIPNETGFTKVKYYNSGEMSNKGWEFRIDWQVFKAKEYGISFNFNFAQNINKIISLPDNLLSNTYSFGNGNYASKIISGDPLGSFYGYRCLGVYQNIQDTYAKDANGNNITDIAGNNVIIKNGPQQVFPGDAKYQDMNNDGIIDQYDIVYLGNAMPKFTGGFGINFKYKNLGLIAYFHGRLGQKVVNIARMDMESMYGTKNQSVAVLGRWRQEGDDTMIPRALYSRGYNYLGSDRFVEDGSFLRMKTLTLKYSLPKLFVQKMGINKLDIYTTAYDLWTITGYTGQDPEVGLSSNIYMLAVDKAVTPKPIRVACGLNINF